MSNESTFNLDSVRIKSIRVGEVIEIPGLAVFSVEAPSKGKPYWLIRHADEYDEREQVLIAAGVPVIITAETKPDEPEEEIVEDEQ